MITCKNAWSTYVSSVTFILASYGITKHMAAEYTFQTNSSTYNFKKLCISPVIIQSLRPWNNTSSCHVRPHQPLKHILPEFEYKRTSFEGKSKTLSIQIALVISNKRIQMMELNCQMVLDNSHCSQTSSTAFPLSLLKLQLFCRASTTRGSS
jgi:hypothetical protein